MNIFIVIVYMCQKKLWSYMLSLQKNNYFLSFDSPIFQWKIHKQPETYFERGWGNSLKQTYVEEGEDTCKMSKEDWVKN